MLENIKLDKTISLPLYYQLKMILLKEIQKENHPLNIPLPPEEKIASLCCVSRTTVRQAIRELVNEGWLYRIKAKGTFISDNQGKKALQSIRKNMVSIFIGAAVI